MRWTTAAIIFLLAGCAATAPPHVWLHHDATFREVPDLPRLPVGVHVVGDKLVIAVSPGAWLYNSRCGRNFQGCYARGAGSETSTIEVAAGAPGMLGHEMGHYCQDRGPEACARTVEAVRAFRP